MWLSSTIFPGVLQLAPWTQTFPNKFGTFGQFFIPFSLSGQMAAAVVYSTRLPRMVGGTSQMSYKLGKTFAYSYPPYSKLVLPVFYRNGQHSYRIPNAASPSMSLYGVSINAAQQAFMMSPVP